MEREHMLNSMLRSISHDLRTPLTGIVGASQLMMNQDHLTNEDVYSLAKDIHDQHIGLLKSLKIFKHV